MLAFQLIVLVVPLNEGAAFGETAPLGVGAATFFGAMASASSSEQPTRLLRKTILKRLTGGEWDVVGGVDTQQCTAI